MKTVFFIIRNPHRINGVLRTDLFNLFRSRSYRVVVVSEYGDDPAFIKEFGGQNVYFERLFEPGRFAQTVAYWREVATQSREPEIQFAVRVHEGITRGFRVRPFLQKLKGIIRDFVLALVPRPIRTSERLWDVLEHAAGVDAPAEPLFERWKPDAVVVTTAGSEKPFLLACVRRGVPSINVDSNIDAPQLRYFSRPRRTTRWALFGEETKKEFMRLHGISEQELIVTGALRYDYLFREFKPEPREAFFRRIGADSSKKLITYAAKTPVMYPHNEIVINAILKAIAAGDLLNSQLFVRFDPNHDLARYGNLLNTILWEQADLAAPFDHVANLLYHSDTTISIASTFASESLILGTPSIWVGFDNPESRDNPTRLHYELAVFKDIVNRGAVRLATTPTELVNYVARHLADKTLDSNARRGMIHDYYHQTDGKAGERIFCFIEKLIA